MLKTIENNSVILIDPDEEVKVVAALMESMNAFVSIQTAEIITTLDKTTQYRYRMDGRFPELIILNHHGRRKAYRLQDLKNWMQDPANYQQAFQPSNSEHSQAE